MIEWLKEARKLNGENRLLLITSLGISAGLGTFYLIKWILPSSIVIWLSWYSIACISFKAEPLHPLSALTAGYLYKVHRNKKD